MNSKHFLPSLLIKATSAAAFIIALSAPLAQAVTVTPLTSGDLGGGLDLTTGQSTVYAVDTFSGGGPTIQGVPFSFATGFSPGNNTSYGAAVTFNNGEYSFNPSYPATNYSPTPTANDTALASVFTNINAGSQQWQYNQTISKTYRLTLLVGLGSQASAYVGDFAFKNGNYSSNPADYNLVLDNFVTSGGTPSYAITYDYTATASTASFSLIYPNTYGATYSGSADPAGAIPLGAWALTEVAAVPEPNVTGIAMAAVLGVLLVLRRRGRIA